MNVTGNFCDGASKPLIEGPDYSGHLWHNEIIAYFHGCAAFQPHRLEDG